MKRFAAALVLLLIGNCAPGQAPAAPTDLPATLDSDHDGLSDAVEQSLLVQFAPAFHVAPNDCSGRPATFTPGLQLPHPATEDGTIYGQVSPAKSSTATDRQVEIHYFHLWRVDCGAHSHPLDTEHVAVLVHATGPDLASAHWKALFWYAAAHENTVCDVSQIARASTLHAVDGGADVWISPGKHASYLNETLCFRGCGADRCTAMVPLPTRNLVNLGEPGHPMNGSVFIASNQWPLAAKMTATNFPPEPLARLSDLPKDEIAWFNPGRHPAQGVIAISSSTESSIAAGGHNTSAAISVAGDSTGAAISAAGDNTGNALGRSYTRTRHALGSSAQHVGKALRLTRNQPAELAPPADPAAPPTTPAPKQP